MNIRKVSTLLALGMVGLTASMAHADTISFTSTVPLTTTSFAGTAVLTKFDTTLGTLTAVDFSLSGNATVNYTIHNTDTIVHNYKANGDVELDFTIPSSTIVLIDPAGTAKVNGVAAGATALGSFGGSDSTTFSEISSNFALYKTFGFGTFNNGYTATGSFGVSGTPPFVGSATEQADASFTVTYTYTATPPPPPMAPEPGSLALLSVSGLGLVGGILRRRKA